MCDNKVSVLNTNNTTNFCLDLMERDTVLPAKTAAAKTTLLILKTNNRAAVSQTWAVTKYRCGIFCNIYH